MISGEPIPHFREGWAVVPFVGQHMRAHYWSLMDDPREIAMIDKGARARGVQIELRAIGC